MENFLSDIYKQIVRTLKVNCSNLSSNEKSAYLSGIRDCLIVLNGLDGQQGPIKTKENEVAIFTDFVYDYNSMAESMQWREFIKKYNPIGLNRDFIGETVTFYTVNDIDSPFFWCVEQGNKMLVIPSLRKNCGGERGFMSAGLRYLFDNVQGKDRDLRIQKAAVLECNNICMPITQWTSGILKY